MKIERHWILAKPAAESRRDERFVVHLGRVRALQLERAVELARNMGVTVDRRWTLELEPDEKRLLMNVMRATDGTSPGCACEVLRAALLMGLIVLNDAVAEEESEKRNDGKNEATETRTHVDPDRTN